jgi:hypothetical protein
MKRFILIVLVIAVTGCASRSYSGNGKLPKPCSKARHKYYNRIIEL